MAEVTITLDELNRLMSLEAIQEPWNKGYVIKEAKMWLELEKLMGGKTAGTKWRYKLYAVPDEILLKLAVEVTNAGNAYGAWKADIGEEDVEGKVPGVDYDKYNQWGDDRAKPVDLSPIGPASYLGKMILELARRLEMEIAKDKGMLGMRGILPPEAAEALEHGAIGWSRGGGVWNGPKASE